MATKLEPIINYMDGEKVDGKVSRHIRKLRRVRNNARRVMRSGHPGRRADAARVYMEVPEHIRAAYTKDYRDRNNT